MVCAIADSITMIYVKKSGSKSSFEPYNIDWIRTLSDEEWKAEREVVRKEFCKPCDEHKWIELRSILDMFDKVKSERDWAGVKPYGPSYSREHGYNLYKSE